MFGRAVDDRATCDGSRARAATAPRVRVVSRVQRVSIFPSLAVVADSQTASLLLSLNYSSGALACTQETICQHPPLI